MILTAEEIKDLAQFDRFLAESGQAQECGLK